MKTAALLIAASLATLLPALEFWGACGFEISMTGPAWVEGQPPDEALQVRCGGFRLDGRVSVRATLTLQGTGILDSLQLRIGTDADGDRVIGPGEWAIAATATVREQGGVTTATIGPVLVSTEGHVYSLEQRYSDGHAMANMHFIDSSYTVAD